MITTRASGLLTVSLAVWMATATLAAGQPRELPASTIDAVYIGIFAGAIAVDSTVTFASDANRPGTKVVDQGGDGAIFALRAGWGMRISQHVYVGLELEGMLPANVNSRYDANGERYRRRVQKEIGTYGRIGWSPDGHSLLFLRGGIAVPLTADDQTAIAVVGAGAEVPIGRRFAGRVDINYAFPYTQSRIETYRLTAGLVLRF